MFIRLYPSTEPPRYVPPRTGRIYMRAMRNYLQSDTLEPCVSSLQKGYRVGLGSETWKENT